MAARKSSRKKTAKKKTTRKKTARKKTSGRKRSRAADLPASLAQFVRQVTVRLNRLEQQLSKTEERYRREWTRTLRIVSRQLGRIEAEGEKRWKKLTDTPRRDAAALLRRLEKAIEPRPRKRSAAARKSGARRKAGARG